MAKGTFRSLKVFNYRVWAIGSSTVTCAYASTVGPTAEPASIEQG